MEVDHMLKKTFDKADIFVVSHNGKKPCY